MEEGLYKKSFVVGIAVLFVIISVFPAVNAAVSYEQTQKGMAQVELSVSITKPLEGHLYISNIDFGETDSGETWIIGAITIEASASGEEWVNFSIGGVYRFTDEEAPYAWTWKDDVVGTAEIKITADDGDGNKVSDSLYVNVIMFFIDTVEIETTMAEAMLTGAVANGDIDADLASYLIENSYTLPTDTSTNPK